MSNTRRATGVKPAFAGKVPPSPDVAERTLAEVIGDAVAVNLAKMMGPMFRALAEAQRRPGCIACAAKVKQAERDYEVAARNAAAAAEPEPDKPDVGVTESFTDGSRGPVCWGCYDQRLDGPWTDGTEFTGPFGALLPPAVD